jgi:MFS family permease
MSLGSSTVRDMFFVHGMNLASTPDPLRKLADLVPERGQKMGIWTIFIGVSPYIAIILDGFVTTYAGWRWMQWLTFLLWAALLIVCATMLPETLYHRDYNLEVAPPKETYFQSLKWKYMGTKFRLGPFARPFIMLKYPSVLLPVFWYGNLYGFCVFGGLGILPFVSSTARNSQNRH